jgi:hypothetical protein
VGATIGERTDWGSGESGRRQKKKSLNVLSSSCSCLELARDCETD